MRGRRLIRHIQEGLREGALPRISGHAWTAMSRGKHRCACCRWRIRSRRMQYEVADDDLRDRLYAHQRCFRVWAAESRRSVDPGHHRLRWRAGAIVAAIVAVLSQQRGGPPKERGRIRP